MEIKMKIDSIKKQKGQTLIFVAVSLLVLIGFLSLAIDVGHFYGERRRMQNAADAGALAGARELCVSNNIPAAYARAQEYAVTRNGAQTANITIQNYTVAVDTGETVPTFFAGLIGVTSADVRTGAAATCGRADSACGVWPVGFNKSSWDSMVSNGMGCGRDFYIWENNQTINCYIYNCDVNNDGRNDIITTGQRGFMDFSSAQAPYVDSCASGGVNPVPCGASVLQCRFEKDHGGLIKLPSCVAARSGVSTSIQNEVNSRQGDAVKLPLYSGSCPPGSTCAGGFGYNVVDFGCVTVLNYVRNMELRAYFGGGYIQGNAIHGRINCGGCETSCGGTSGNPPIPGGLNAVSLTQ
jgi:hypothetical protein